MARTAAGATLTLAHQRMQRALVARVLGQLLRLWPAVDTQRPETFDLFNSAATLLVRDGHRSSSGLASRYYAGFRMAEGFETDVRTTLAPVPETDRVSQLLRGAAVTGILRARAAGLTAVAEGRQGWVQLAGQATSLVVGGGRETTLLAVEADPQAQGFQRVTAAPCAFCAMLASRGPVSTEEAAGFEAHDHCQCVAEPAYPGTQPTPGAAGWRALWDEATAGLSGRDAYNAFRQAMGASTEEAAA